MQKLFEWLPLKRKAAIFDKTKSLVSSYTFYARQQRLFRHYFDHSDNPYRELELAEKKTLTS